MLFLRQFVAVLAIAVVVAIYASRDEAEAKEPAQPRPMPESEANQLVFSRDKAESMVSDVAIEYYVKKYRVSRAEAKRRLGTQMIAPNLHAPLGKELGEDLSGIWFDNRTGEWVVQVSEDSASKAAEGVLDRLGLGKESRVDQVGFTRTGVLEAKRELGTRLKRTLVGEADMGHIGLGAEAIQVKLPEELGGEARKRVMSVAKAVESIPDRPPVEVEYVNQEALRVDPAACTAPTCDELTAGVRVSVGSAGGGCTAAFKGMTDPGTGPSPGHNWFTAGHCLIFSGGSTGEPWRFRARGQTNWDTMGTVTAAYWGNGFGDAAMMHRSNNMPGIPGFVDWSTNQVNYLHGWKTSSASVGLVSCFHGATSSPSGSQCGTVSDNDWDGWIHGQEFKDMIRVNDHCVKSGDSGSPVTGPGQVAVGILSGTNYACPGGFSINEPIHRPVGLWNNIPIVWPI